MKYPSCTVMMILANAIFVNSFAFGPPSPSLPITTHTRHSQQSLVALYMSSESEWESMTVDQLKNELRSRGLKVSGKKQELLDRLVETLSENEEEEDDEEEEEEYEDDNEDISVETKDTSTVTTETSSQKLTFATLGLTPTFQQCAKTMGWANPTPIQKLTIPAILNELNSNDRGNYNSVWSEAPTGSGKTGGYALPLMQLLTQQKRQSQLSSSSSSSSTLVKQNKGKVKALILVPTRELAMQISWVIQDMKEAIPPKYQSTHLNSLVIHGGVPLEPQIQAMAAQRKSGKGIDILIATPGRLVDVLLHYTKQEEEGIFAKKQRKQKNVELDLEKAADAALEQKLLAALDNTGKTDASLTLQKLMDAKLDKIDAQDADGRNMLSDMLDSLQYLVIDEADRLLGQPFQKELDPLLKLLPSWSRQYLDNDKDFDGTMKSMLFSATFPEQIQPRYVRVINELDDFESY